VPHGRRSVGTDAAVERRPVRHHGHDARQDQLAARERVVVPLELEHAPRRATEGSQAAVDVRLVVAVLLLEVVLTDEQPLGPKWLPNRQNEPPLTALATSKKAASAGASCAVAASPLRLWPLATSAPSSVRRRAFPA